VDRALRRGVLYSGASIAGITAMLKISVTEFERRLADYERRALDEPVAITRDGRERLVLLSADEYWRLKENDRLVRRAGELTDDELAAIAVADVPAREQRFEDEHG
jgi:prevent-host-death family protein